MNKKVITGLLLILILCRFGWLVYQNRNKYLPDYWQRYPVLKTVYSESQYTTKNYKYLIPDETGYSYAAGAYILGANPILIESTQPPLGKYILGLSILLTGSENIAILLFFICLLTGIYLLVQTLTHSRTLALLTVFAALFEPLFTDQLKFTPLLDTIFITFLVYAILTAGRAIESKKPHYLIVTYLCLASAMMTKVWIITAVFAAPVTIYILMKKWQYYPYIILGFFVVLGVTLLTYMRMFFDHYTVIQVIKVQKWLYWYHSSKINRIGTIWPLIFLNRWYVWWGNTPVIKDQNWSLSWPVVIGTTLVACVRVLFAPRKKSNPMIQLCAIAVVCYSIFMSLGQASARYLIPVLPFGYALTAWLLYTVAKRIIGVKKLL
jgi:hypothetical protein